MLVSLFLEALFLNFTHFTYNIYFTKKYLIILTPKKPAVTKFFPITNQNVKIHIYVLNSDTPKLPCYIAKMSVPVEPR